MKIYSIQDQETKEFELYSSAVSVYSALKDGDFSDEPLALQLIELDCEPPCSQVSFNIGRYTISCHFIEE